jgi:hypothetical protein
MMTSYHLRGSTNIYIVSVNNIIIDPKKHDFLQSSASSAVLKNDASEGLDIQMKLRMWYSDFLKWTAVTARDPQSTIALIYYHATTIFLSGMFDYYHSWYKDPTPTIPLDEVQEHVTAILDLSEVALFTTNLSWLLFFFPLRVAGARARSLEDQRRILTMLGDISRRRFVVADSFVLDLNAWWDLVGTSMG